MMKLFEELGKVKLGLSRFQGDLSAFEAVRKLESEVHNLSARCKNYEKKIVDARENTEAIVQSQINKYLKSDEFKGKVFEQSTRFYATGFNNGLLKACESPTIPFRTLCVIEYDYDGEEVQYGSNNCALLKVRPPPPHGTLDRLAAAFDQGASKVGDGPPVVEAVNALMDPPSASDVIVISTSRLLMLQRMLLKLSPTWLKILPPLERLEDLSLFL